MKDYYSLKLSDGIYLYGAASIGKIVFDSISRAGCKIIGFIDKRADEISSFCGLPVFKSDDRNLNRDFPILIAVKNVFEHSRIAESLSSNGFKKIIFRPFNCLNGNGSALENETNNAYSLFTENSDNLPSTLILPYYKIDLNFETIKLPIKERNAGRVKIPIPVQLLFTDKKFAESVYNILYLKPHIDFVRYILGLSGGEKESYLDFCIDAAKTQNLLITEEWKKNVIKNRTEVFEQMIHKWNCESEFFIKNAPFVEYDSRKKRFYLQSGKHRAALLSGIGANYICVNMSESDFTIYADEVEAKNYYVKYGGRISHGMNEPIENPFFYDFSSSCETYYFNLLRATMCVLRKWFYHKFNDSKIEGKRALVAVKENGFIKRALVRLGVSVYSAYPITEEEKENNRFLLGEKNFLKILSADIDQKYDFAIIDDTYQLKNPAMHCLRIKNKLLATDTDNIFGEGLKFGEKYYFTEEK